MGSMSDHFNRTSVGEGALGLLERAARNGDTDTIKKLLGHTPPPPPASEPAAPAPEEPAQPPAEVKTELGADLAVLKPANVRSRVNSPGKGR